MKIVPLWKHPHYTISDTCIITNVITNKVSTLSLNKEGYLVVKINYTQYLLHRLLMFSFKLDSYFKDAVVDHIDGNKANNNLDNLEWVTTRINSSRARIVVPYKQSKESITIAADKQAISKRKLTNAQIREIRTAFDTFPTYANSMPMQLKRERSNLIQEFCIKFNISYSVVGRIIRKEGRYNNEF